MMAAVTVCGNASAAASSSPAADLVRATLSLQLLWLTLLFLYRHRAFLKA